MTNLPNTIFIFFKSGKTIYFFKFVWQDVEHFDIIVGVVVGSVAFSQLL